MKQQIYTIELLRKLLEKGRKTKVWGYSDHDSGSIQRFIDILELGELVKDEGLEVVIVKRKNGKFVK